MYIKLETAKLAKLKGFNLEVRGHYSPKSKFGENYQEHIGRFNSNKDNIFLNDKGINRIVERYSAPSQEELSKWLREVHDIHLYVEVLSSGMFIYVISQFLQTDEFDREMSHDKYVKWEDAMEEGLFQALQLIDV